ncbi:MAG: peptide chain release factor N(5)-glutamine methyltransferase [Fimbriimonadaceae bacterium]
MGRAACDLCEDMTVGEWLGYASSRLAEAGSSEARAEASLLLVFATGLSKTQLLASPDLPAPDSMSALLDRRLGGEPVAYITRSREFYSREFMVSPAVLVPRHETETLVDVALFFGPPPGSRVLDVGTGSGCLAITLALERPDLVVCASDLAPEALAIARENAACLGAEVEFREGDLLDPWRGERFHLMVSNPPYVALDEALSREVAAFEPKCALYAGEDGLEFYRRLAHEAASHLEPTGALVVEAGDGAARAVEEVFVTAGWTAGGWQDDLIPFPRAGTFLPPPLGSPEPQ